MFYHQVLFVRAFVNSAIALKCGAKTKWAEIAWNGWSISWWLEIIESSLPEVPSEEELSCECVAEPISDDKILVIFLTIVCVYNFCEQKQTRGKMLLLQSDLICSVRPVFSLLLDESESNWPHIKARQKRCSQTCQQWSVTPANQWSFSFQRC